MEGALLEAPLVEQPVETLDSEIKKFVDELPYWQKYLAEKILSGNTISEDEIETAYSYLLEELTLKEATEKPEIIIHYDGGSLDSYKLDLLFTKLENVEGVNALAENQVIEISPYLTIIYGVNGSGKSGYVRLMKKVFYSKAPEEIHRNIHLENGHKAISADFTFQSGGSEIPLKYPDHVSNAEFRQFAVFDHQSVIRHLGQPNEFVFRPAGLSFFAHFTDAIIEVERQLFSEISMRRAENHFPLLFDGETVIKTILENLSAETDVEELRKHLPYSEEDKAKKAEVEKKYDNLLLATKGKQKAIAALENVKTLLTNNKTTIEQLNQYFTSEYITQIQTTITDCVTKEATAKAEGIEKFKTDKIQAIGTLEWKNFITAAEQFAKKQKGQEKVYPESDDNCLLCQQPLSEEAQKLISNYWAFIKSVAEQNAKDAAAKLTRLIEAFGKLSFDLFPADNTLTAWLTENHEDFLTSVKQELSKQKTLAGHIISDLTTKTLNVRHAVEISVAQHDTIIAEIEASIKSHREDTQQEELSKLLVLKTYYAHKEKLGLHIDKIDAYVANQKWIAQANSISWQSIKKGITDGEKYLSGKYFNQKYIDTFNTECDGLNGNFDISIDSRGSGGKSLRQLWIKGNSPSAILSEGEQKVIALADFLAEMQLSEVNRGLVFDDPVTSLDHEWKDVIAKRLVKESKTKQVVILTHDVVFTIYLEKHAKKNFGTDISQHVKFHCIEQDNGQIGLIGLNTSPIKDSTYNNSNVPRQHLAKARKESGEYKALLVRSGYSALRACYEAITVHRLLGSTVQRFDSQVRVGNIKRVKYDKQVYESIAEKYGWLHDLIEGHLPVEEFNLSFTCDKLEGEISAFETILERLETL